MNLAKVVGIDGFGYGPALAQMSRAKGDHSRTNAFGGIGRLGIVWAIMITMQPSLTTMKTVTAFDQSLHLRNIEKNPAPVARERRRESKVLERKWELFVSLVPRGFTAHPRVRLPLEMKRLLPVHYIFSGSRARSLLGKPVYVRNFEQKFEQYLHTKQRPLWLHVSYYTHFNQPSTINNIAALTRAWHKKSSHTRDTMTFKCILYSESVLYYL